MAGPDPFIGPQLGPQPRDIETATALKAVGVVLLFFVLFMFVFVIPTGYIGDFTYSAGIEYTGEGNFTLYLPLVLDEDEQVLSDPEDFKVTGDAELSIVSTKYGNALAVVGSSDTSIRLHREFDRGPVWHLSMDVSGSNGTDIIMLYCDIPEGADLDIRFNIYSADMDVHLFFYIGSEMADRDVYFRLNDMPDGWGEYEYEMWIID